MDLNKAIETRTKAQRKLEGLQAAIEDAATDIEKAEAIVKKAQANVDKSLEDGAKGAHRLDALRKAKAKLTEAINWHQELTGQVSTAKADIQFAKQQLPDILRRAVKEEADKLVPEMEQALDLVHSIIKKADKIYLDYAKKYGTTLAPQDREFLLPMVAKVKPEWTGWIGPFTRGLQNEMARLRAGEYS